MSITFVIGYLLARFDGIKQVDALKAQYAEEDKAAAEAVTKLTKDLKDQCQADKDYILNNRQGK